MSHSVPLPGLADDLAQAPIGKGGGETKLLDQAHHLGAGEAAAPRVIPAHQGLQGLQAAGAGVEDGLIDKMQAVALDGRREFLAQRGGTRIVGEHVLIEELEAVAALALDLVEGQIGAVHQAILLRRVLGTDRGADTGANLDAMAQDLVGFAQGLQHPRGDGIDVPDAGDMKLDDGEFVTPEPGHHIPAPHLLAQALGDLDQEGVPRRVTILVVDRLEAVQVDHEHRRQHLVPQADGDRLLQLALEHGAVAEAGQGVGQGQAFQPDAFDVLDQHLPQQGGALQVGIQPGQGLAVRQLAPDLEGGAGGEFQQGVVAVRVVPGLAGPGDVFHLLRPHQEDKILVGEGQIEQAAGEAHQCRIFFQARRYGGAGRNPAPVVGVQPVLEDAQAGLVRHIAAEMTLVVEVGPGALGSEGLAKTGQLDGDDLLAAAHRLELQARMGTGGVLVVARPLEGEALQIRHVDRGDGGDLFAPLAAGEGDPARRQVMTGNQAPEVASHQDGDAEGGLDPQVLQVLDVDRVDGAQFGIRQVDLGTLHGRQYRHGWVADMCDDPLALDEVEAAGVGGDIAGGKVEPQKAPDPGPQDLGHHLAVPAGEKLIEHDPVVAGDARHRLHQGLGRRLFGIRSRQGGHAPGQGLAADPKGGWDPRFQFDDLIIARLMDRRDQGPPSLAEGPQSGSGKCLLAGRRQGPVAKIRRQGLTPILAQQGPRLLAQPGLGVGGHGGDPPARAMDGEQGAIGLNAIGQVQIGVLAVTEGGIDHGEAPG